MVREPARPEAPLSFSMLRVPFFLEPGYSRSEEFEETNRVRLHRKWGSEQGFKTQKQVTLTLTLALTLASSRRSRCCCRASPNPNPNLATDGATGLMIP